jgi:hypothetical protein
MVATNHVWLSRLCWLSPQSAALSSLASAPVVEEEEDVADASKALKHCSCAGSVQVSSADDRNSQTLVRQFQGYHVHNVT